MFHFLVNLAKYRREMTDKLVSYERQSIRCLSLIEKMHWCFKKQIKCVRLGWDPGITASHSFLRALPLQLLLVILLQLVISQIEVLVTTYDAHYSFCQAIIMIGRQTNEDGPIERLGGNESLTKFNSTPTLYPSHRHNSLLCNHI